MRTPGVASQLASRAAGVRADVTFLLVDALLSIAAYALVLLVSTDISQEHTDRLALFAGSAVAAHLGANAAFGRNENSLSRP